MTLLIFTSKLLPAFKKTKIRKKKFWRGGLEKVPVRVENEDTRA
jgi:hypothetical protein